MVPKELLRKVRRIQIRTSHVVSDALAGQYHSAFKGRGMEFEEVRQYQVGDDVRAIDWNVSARYGEPYVKLFREERELTVMLLVDFSGSQDFGAVEQLKRDLAAELCATLAFSASVNNDKVGLIGFTDRIELVVPPRKGTRHVLRIVREVLAFEPAGRCTRIAASLEHLERIMHRRAVVFVVSDFLDEGWERSFRIARRRHDVIPIVISDPREHELPPVGLVEMLDRETGERLVVDTGSRRVRQRFAALAAAADAERRQLFRRLGVDAIDARCGEDWVEPLTRFFRRREARP